MKSKTMEAVSNRLAAFRMCRRRGVSQVMFLCLVIALSLQSSCSAAGSGQSGSVRAELFHYEHPFSLSLQSETTPLGYEDKLQNAGKRSAERVRSLIKRRLSGESGAARSATWETTVNDAPVAEYVMTISIGTPPQSFVAVADTGSDLTWLQCKTCEACFSQPSPVYDPTLSSTYKNLSCSSEGCSAFIMQYGELYVSSCQQSESTCEYSYVYGDTSNTTGTFSSETVTLKSVNGTNITVPDFWFGCSHASFSSSALFDSTDGLVGLGQGLISFPSQLGDVFEDKFSYCLVNRSLAAVQSSPLVFGTAAVPDVELQYTPIICNEFFPYYYYIGVEGISVAESPVDFNVTAALGLDVFGNGGMIIDSGTTYTYLNPLAFDALLTAIDTKFPSTYGRVTLPPAMSYLELCFDVTGRPNFGNDLPEISLKLANSTSWTLAPDNAWLLIPDMPQIGSITICLSIMRGEEGVFSILGNTQQQDFHLLYDRVEKRIGFAKIDCSSV